MILLAHNIYTFVNFVIQNNVYMSLLPEPLIPQLRGWEQMLLTG